jgi:hypothetical protein
MTFFSTLSLLAPLSGKNSRLAGAHLFGHHRQRWRNVPEKETQVPPVQGGLFAYAGLRGVWEQKNVIGPLCAADLIGGCLGAILGSLALIPIFGLSGTLKGMILLATLALLLI